MHRYKISDAVNLAEASYSGKRHTSLTTKIKRSLDKDDVQAHLMTNGILLIPGSNSLMDYLRFNLRIMNIGGKRYRMSDETTQKGASGTVWHQGFLAHAKVIYDWIEHHDEKPIYIIGHSLGAAATQILSKSWAVPGIGFAAPRTRRSRGRIKNDGFCLCINRNDDTVCDLPTSFKHMGKVHRCAPKSSVFGPDHAMKHYRTAVADQQGDNTLPVQWP
ncbi:MULTISPECIES: hypothetical protein [Ascidiaceihabitans]|uniref:Fungal lipase-like domain-containing protein n=1 Tax=Ascidiaceihabitans donghaensis TaxID=1510460 RepID=A0A2R8BC00_9RHOB|nr:hypothetical protein [Ascidiaceihabitans donghaensis]SPH20575.1 hypothetical protein ASD8599_01312 [Ascidiaceihabitans donghaensis]